MPFLNFPLEFGRGFSHIALENPREKGKIFKANRPCDLGDRVSLRKKLHGGADAYAMYVCDDALTRVLTEEVTEGVLALIERRGDTVEREPLRVVQADIFQRAQHGFVLSRDLLLRVFIDIRHQREHKTDECAGCLGDKIRRLFPTNTE